MMSLPRSLLLIVLSLYGAVATVFFYSPALSETAEEFVTRQRLQGKKANRLINERSPYLLKHAFNPVNWYPWGDEPFRRAAEEKKPVLLSIGYSTCHWCNVMEEESFDNASTATFLNEHFIAIKVDREERPDVDQMYMEASFALTGKGGWPLTLFLTSGRQPFYAGTYFPAEKSFGQPSFMEVLIAINEAWQSRREQLVTQAAEVIAQLIRSREGGGPSGSSKDDIQHKVYQQLRERYDPVHGGFGTGSKFPRPVALAFLLRYSREKNDSNALAMVEKTLQAMADGGIHDHLEGGFHRYSVDTEWRTPHFEKMLYDQAQLASAYLDAYRLTGNPVYSHVGRSICDFVLTWMTLPEGGFFSAEGADSQVSEKDTEKKEGAYYVWGASEVFSVLGEQDGRLFSYAFGVEEKGNSLVDPRGELADRNILYRAHSDQETGLRFGIPPQEVEVVLERCRQKLKTVRKLRPRPYLDDKIIASWNGLMISSLASAHEVFGEIRYLEAASLAGDFLYRHLYDEKEGILYRAFRQERTSIQGLLIDYACVAKAYLDLFRAGQNIKWLQRAERLCDNIVQHFFDAEKKLWKETSLEKELPASVRFVFEGAEPSGLAVTGRVFGQLASLVGDKKWRDSAENVKQAALGLLARNPSAMPALTETVTALSSKPRQIILFGNGDDAGLEKMQQAVFERYLPGTSLIVLAERENREFFCKRLPETALMRPLGDRATAFFCEDFVCRLPTSDFDVFQNYLH